MAWEKGRRGLGGTALWGRGLVGTGSWLEARPWGVAEPGRGWSHIAWWEARGTGRRSVILAGRGQAGLCFGFQE